MITKIQIYVALLDESVTVWRPVQAEHLGSNHYRIISQPYDRSIEKWQFEPGEEVECDLIESSDGIIMAAIRKASSS